MNRIDGLMKDHMMLSLLRRLEGPLPQRCANIDTGELADDYRLTVTRAERRCLAEGIRFYMTTPGTMLHAPLRSLPPPRPRGPFTRPPNPWGLVIAAVVIGLCVGVWLSS